MVYFDSSIIIQYEQVLLFYTLFPIYTLLLSEIHESSKSCEFHSIFGMTYFRYGETPMNFFNPVIKSVLLAFLNSIWFMGPRVPIVKAIINRFSLYNLNVCQWLIYAVFISGLKY